MSMSKSNKTIEEVKEAWDKQLMAMPSVMAVGIGMTKDRREKCIKVYVNEKTSTQTVLIPKDIEGYPVEVEIRQAFQSL